MQSMVMSPLCSRSTPITSIGSTQNAVVEQQIVALRSGASSMSPVKKRRWNSLPEVATGPDGLQYRPDVTSVFRMCDVDGYNTDPIECDVCGELTNDWKRVGIGNFNPYNAATFKTGCPDCIKKWVKLTLQDRLSCLQDRADSQSPSPHP